VVGALAVACGQWTSAKFDIDQSDRVTRVIRVIKVMRAWVRAENRTSLRLKALKVPDWDNLSQAGRYRRQIFGSGNDYTCKDLVSESKRKRGHTRSKLRASSRSPRLVLVVRTHGEQAEEKLKCEGGRWSEGEQENRRAEGGGGGGGGGCAQAREPKLFRGIELVTQPHCRASIRTWYYRSWRVSQMQPLSHADFHPVVLAMVGRPCLGSASRTPLRKEVHTTNTNEFHGGTAPPWSRQENEYSWNDCLNHAEMWGRGRTPQRGRKNT